MVKHDGARETVEDTDAAFMGRVLDERRRQDDEHGGPDHDDEHDERDWLSMARSFLARADLALQNGDATTYYRRCEQVAAILSAQYGTFVRRGERLHPSVVEAAERARSTQGWAFLPSTTRAHYFDTSRRSLCLRWWAGRGVELQDDMDDHPENCVTCRKRIENHRARRGNGTVDRAM